MLNNAPLLLLRANNKSFKKKQRLLNRRVKDRRQLREEIYSDHNIFQSSVNLYRNMTAQNIIWDKNYNYKCVINAVKEDNSSLKARIWNVEKENRRMERQIDSWNLADYAASGLTKKPYIDMATVEKVLIDQDYNIVSMKMTICDLEKTLALREQHLQGLVDRSRDMHKLSSLLNHEIALRKVEVCECIQLEHTAAPPFERDFRDRMAQLILRQNQQLDLIAKNTEIKKKSKANIETDLQTVRSDCELQKDVTYAEIERLSEETSRMRAEEDGGLNLAREKLKLAQKQLLDYECYMQAQMGEFIKRKLPLQLEIDALRQQLAQPHPAH